MEASVVETRNDVSPRTVRTNWLLFSWSQISGATKVLLLISISLALIQITVTIVVLVLGNQQHLTCEKPLQLYLTVFLVRVGLSLPLSVYQHLFIPRRRRANRFRNNVSNTAAPTNNETTSNENSPSSNENISSNANTPNNVNLPSNNTAESGQHRPSTIVSGWAERLKSLLDLFAILWFIVGNYLLFSSSSCSSRAGLYYYTILAWILFGYTILVIPLLACASVIFCLPCVLVAMRTFNINISNVMVGGTKEEIAKIPVFKYKSTEEQQPTESAIPIMKKANYFSKFTKGNSKENVTTDKYLTIPKAEDAICTICLSEYENDELVCKLWCDHHYHHSCVTEWLGLNSKCPLCKRDFRKDHVDEDSDEEV